VRNQMDVRSMTMDVGVDCPTDGALRRAQPCAVGFPSTGDISSTKYIKASVHDRLPPTHTISCSSLRLEPHA
jgi:hypothetical protein